MKLNNAIIRFVLAGTLLITGFTGIQSAHSLTWSKVTLEGLVDQQGQLLSSSGAVLSDRGGNPLVPSCAFGADSDPFIFFTQQGSGSNGRNLLIFHDGGGACWEKNTCYSGLVATLATGATYEPHITETTDNLLTAGGILDGANTRNPFQGWTKVFIPYCTGDIGWGNNDVQYIGLPFPIHHRGYANIKAVLRWLENQYPPNTNKAPSRIMVSGDSAGAYASPFIVFPEVKSLYPEAKTYVIADSSNGIVTNSFLEDARQNWRFESTLPSYLVPLTQPSSGGADGLPVRFYSEMAARFPFTRFGQFQNAYDGIQTLLYNITKSANDPAKWTDSSELAQSLIEWSTGARLAVTLSAWAPNYRFYTAAGTQHTILVNIPPEANLGFCSDDFYNEKSAGGLSFRNWVYDMVNHNGSFWFTGNWRNATCFPNCLPATAPSCGS